MNKIIYFWITLACFLCSSCNDYLNIAPKGNKIPTTLADFEALLRDQYTISRTPVENALYLLNDVYLTNAKVNTPSLGQANYMWDESADRIMLNNADEGTYYVLYGAISSCNLIIANAPAATEATDAERKEVMAYAKVIRALCYDVLVNYYADTYDKATAAEKRSVPLITSADIDAPYTQVSIQEMYDFIIQDTKEAIEMGIPAQSMTAIHPNLGAAYALLARVYLQMQNYDEALRYANLALEQNNQLFDWNVFYEDHQAAIDDPDNYDKIVTPMQYDYVENYYLRYGVQSNFDSYEYNIPVERAERFEEGDARFLSRWKLKVDNNDTYYKALESGFFNHGQCSPARFPPSWFISHFMMGYFKGGAGLSADFYGFSDRVHHMCAFLSHVSHIQGSVFRQNLRELYQFICFRIASRRIYKARRHCKSAVAQ